MSITAQDVTSSRRLPRSVAVLIVAVCSSLFVVAGTNAQPASAKIDTLYLERMLKTVPKSAAGAATVVGGTLTGAGLASTAAAAVAGYFVFDASYDATTALLEWQFGEEFVPETGTSTPGGNWGWIADPASPQCIKPAYHYSGVTSVCVISAPPYRVSGDAAGYSVGTFRLAVTATAGTPLEARVVCHGGVTYTGSVVYAAGATTVYPEVTVTSGNASYCQTAALRVNSAGYVDVYYLGTPTVGPAPDHKWRSVVTCPGGGTVTSISTATFKQADADLPAIVPPTCPADAPAVALDVYEGDSTGAGGTKRVEWTADPAQPFAECLKGGAQYPCSLTLYKLTPAGPKDCTTADLDCTSYDPETSLDTEYLCHWGNYTAPLDDCAPLDSLQTGPSPSDPLDPTDPVPGTLGAGTTVHNPDGSTTHTQTQTLPDGTTRTVTTTTHPDGSKTITTQPTNPDGTPNGAPSVVNLPAPGTGSEPGTDGETAGCMGSWTWNPVAWVYRPVKCALQWAFVPAPGALQAEFAEVDTAWDASGPGALTQGLNDLAAPILTMDENVPTDCLGPQYTLPLPASRSFSMHPLSTCGELTQLILGIVYPLETALIYLGGFLLGLRIVTRPFGMDTPGTTEAASA